MTDRQTDRQTDARGKTICLPTLKGGDIARRLILVDTCIKFREYSLSGFQFIERTWFL